MIKKELKEFPHITLDPKTEDYKTFLKISKRLRQIGDVKTNGEFDWSNSFNIPEETESKFLS